MTRLSLSRDRRGTAAIEFALILPVMMLLGVGLVDTVLGNLLMIDVEMAANVGARIALRPGATPHQVSDAMIGLGVSGLEPKMTEFRCGSKRKNDANNKYDEYEYIYKTNKSDENSGKKTESAYSAMDTIDICNTLPYGQYMRIVAAARRIPLLGMARSTTITAINHVRLP